jgi:hypothetical protein
MGERHDNTRPAQSGSHNISPAGIVSYFPIQEAGFLKPLLGLVLFQRPDGEIFIACDERWAPLQGVDE